MKGDYFTMRKNFGAKPWVYPMPVFIIATYDEDGKANAMNAAWGGVCDYSKISIIIDRNHKTTKNILERKAFTVSIADVPHIIEADYFGIVSGNKVPDKIEKSGLHCIKSEFVDAPLIEEFPLTLECRLISYDDQTERVIAEVINTAIDESILTDDKIDLSKFSPIIYDSMNHDYIALGKKVGKAFSDGNKLK